MVLYQTLISLLAAESLCVRGKTGEKKKKEDSYIARASAVPPPSFFFGFWIFDSRDAFAAAPFTFPANGSGIILRSSDN